MHASKSIVSFSVSFELLHTVKSSLASAPSFSGWIYARLRRILLAVMAKLPGTCERAGVRVERVRSVARIRVRMNLYVCVCLACTPWVTIHTLLCPCLRAKRRTNRSREMAICRRNERTFRSGSRWWYIFRQEVSWIFFVDFFILVYSGLWIASRWFVWNRA